jgi:hypothetical protein
VFDTRAQHPWRKLITITTVSVYPQEKAWLKLR